MRSAVDVSLACALRSVCCAGLVWTWAQLVASMYTADPTEVVHGTWRGLAGSIAPDRGHIAIELDRDGAGRCAVSGESATSSGNGWVFRGKTTVHDEACALRVTSDSVVSGELALRMTWNGRMKGIGGDDWTDVEGDGLCTGPLIGSPDGAGTWQGECVNARARWSARFEWTLVVSPLPRILIARRTSSRARTEASLRGTEQSTGCSRRPGL